MYFALRGPNHDGHGYVAAAIEKGAAAVVVERAAGAPCELVVPNTECALQALASWARRKWAGRVIGVTGSAGKTTTKDAIAHLLGTALPAGKTNGNFNNHVGVPLSLLRLPDACRAAVIEMGMNHAGEIRLLTAIAKPDIAVVTNVGYAHVEFFDSIEGIAAAKRELIEGLPPDGVAVLNADDPRVSSFRDVHPGRAVCFGFSEGAEVRGEDVEFGVAGSRFRALGVDFETPMSGRHAVMNLLAAIAVAHVFEIPPEGLRPAVASFAVGNMRGQRTLHQGIVIWNDCYNSNPEAAQSMLDVLCETPAVRRIAVLGEMLELGSATEELHRRVGRYAGRSAAGRGVDLLIGVRGAARFMVEAAAQAGVAAEFFEDPAEAGEHARQLAGVGDAVLFKGSRGVQVEKALERFTA
ncbi:MAG: UDP-N-acetylmuramoyl-tripeptide--D-alanyl-D-alanine ligase [Candidatus Solibacter sp.]|nr:UDP-N-acetylmuramoyl-tripeptide--D-alanyl-D-alanine ligase [Candidatus Solibacter sp.]